MEKAIFQPDFLIIPGPVAFNKKLQPVDKNVYGVVYWLHNLKDGKCTASNAYLAKICGCGLQSVKNSLNRLEKAKLIIREFNDSKNVKRAKITPLVDYGGTQMSTGGYSNINHRGYSNMTTDKEELISKSISVPTSGTDGKDSEEKKEDRPMNLSQFVEWCKVSSQAHIRIIGEWAETTKPGMKTVGQWEAFIKRHLRPARALVPFSHEQLEAGFARMREAKYLDTVTLETLYKFITNAKIK